MRLRFLILTLFLFSLTACGNSSPPAAPASANEGVPAVERYKLRVAAITQPGTPWNLLYGEFEKRLKANPEGARFDLEMFVLAQLGSEESNLTNMRRGRIEFGGYSLQGASSMVPELSVILAPYLFDSEAEVDFVMDQYLKEPFAEMFADQGAILLDWTEIGWTQIYSVKPIITPEQAQGVPLRSSTAPGAQVFGKAIGSRVISIPFPEVTTALQTGMIQGGQSGIGIYALAGMSNEAKHLTLTNHAYDTGVLVANRDWFDGLDQAAKEAFTAALGTPQASRTFIRTALGELLENSIPQSGATVHVLSDAQRAAWKAKTVGTHDALIKKVGGRAQEIYDLIQAGKIAYRESAESAKQAAPQS